MTLPEAIEHFVQTNYHPKYHERIIDDLTEAFSEGTGGISYYDHVWVIISEMMAA